MDVCLLVFVCVGLGAWWVLYGGFLVVVCLLLSFVLWRVLHSWSFGVGWIWCTLCLFGLGLTVLICVLLWVLCLCWTVCVV